MTDDLESRRVRAEEAKQFMSNPLYRAMFEGVESYLKQVGLSCEPDNKEKAQRVVISMQLLEALRLEIERRVNDGDFASFQIQQLEKDRGMVKRFFQR